jgi:hypothetical protein
MAAGIFRWFIPVQSLPVLIAAALAVGLVYTAAQYWLNREIFTMFYSKIKIALGKG